MAGSLIAIIGSVTHDSPHKFLPQEAAVSIGRELARAGCRILVYSSDPEFIDYHVVRGYIASGQAEPSSIKVLYPRGNPLSFPELIDNPQIFEFGPDNSVNWEVAFYQSLQTVDGVFMLGGGQSTLIAGLIALSNQIPLVSVTTFGGAAKEVWASIVPGGGPVTEQQKRLMNSQEWSDELAQRLVEALLLQRGRVASVPQAPNKAEQVSPKRLSVFLCHSSSDKKAVRTLYHQLSASGVKPWLDEENLLPGEEWARVIPKAVRSSDVVLVCLSQQSLNKKGYIQREIRIALDAAEEQPEDVIFLIPVKLEACDIPDRLSKWHWVNLYEETGYQRLVRSLKTCAETLGVAIK